MIYAFDDYESLNNTADKVNQSIQQRENALSYEDRLLFSKLESEQDKQEKVQQSFIPIQIMNTFYQTPVTNQQQQLINNRDLLQNEDELKLIENYESNSDTQSLSIINEQQQQFILVEQQQWQLILNQYGNIFQAFADDIIVKTNYYINIVLNQNKCNFQNQINNNKVYLAFQIRTKEWIVVKEQQLQNQSLIETAQQFVIHNYIYKLYPNLFLKLFVPVYVDQDQQQNDRLKFISLSEEGLVDLYQYSQQKLIKDLEFQLIIQQIFQQIQLLHKKYIAHRDIKPQNIIYVEHKGWVLCDFENSFRYIDINGFYDIKGTYAFLIPQLQLKSKMRGVQMKQNLLQNDLYALAVTLIVIKYQIQSQDLIMQYLNIPNDPIIEILLKSASLSDMQNYIINYEMRFIRPQLQQIQQSPQNCDIYTICQFVKILGYLNQINQISNKGRFQLFNKIDEQLLKEDKYKYHFNRICYQIIPQYVDQLQNIINYKQLRQRKYWKKIIQRSAKTNTYQMLNQIKLMQVIGLTELFLFYAQQYLKIKYDFTIQIVIIDLLDNFQNYEEAQNQFNILLTYREFYQMNHNEYLIFLKYTSNKYHQQLNQQQKDIWQQFSQCNIFFINNKDLLLNLYSDEEFIEQFIQVVQEIFQIVSILWYWKLDVIKKLIQDIFIVKNIKISLKLLEILKQKIKFNCVIITWQDLLKMEIQLNELLRVKHDKNLIKKMSYVILFNSESGFQQDVLKFNKFFIQFYCNSKKISFRLKIIKKIQLLIRNLLQCSIKLYRSVQMKELLLIIIVAHQQKILYKMFSILVYTSKQLQLLDLLEPLEQDQFRKLIIQCYRDTNNSKRLQKLVTKDKLFIRATYKNLVLYKQIDIINEQFIFYQYLFR